MAVNGVGVIKVSNHSGCGATGGVVHRKAEGESCSNLLVIFTGSAVGLVNLLINPKPDSPLYGRPPVQVRLNPWSEGDALEY